MKANIGTLDRVVRLVLGLFVLALGYYFQSWWGLIGLLPVLTAVFRFCPAYLPFGLNTCATKDQGQPPAA
ncbi:MAG: DUF2892 domain-containing protein [Opitutae bacterium]|nr:DUF2892 domain-containing protein [Opitutae bacterium]